MSGREPVAPIVGYWREPEARTLTHCPSYYAADTETLAIPAGRYPVRLSFAGGYTVPMPQWLLVGIDCTRVSGRLFSGFGGVNFAHRDLPAGEPVRHCLQLYAYQAAELEASGRLELLPGFEWVRERKPWEHVNAPKDWQAVSALLAAERDAVPA